MTKTEITKLRKEFWKKNFNKYTTEPNENGFDWDIGSMLDDFAESVVKNNAALSDVIEPFSCFKGAPYDKSKKCDEQCVDCKEEQMRNEL